MENLQSEVEAISRIPAITSMLEVICRTTGMGFAAVARVTDDRWVACGVRDEIQFGLVPGGELQLATTICNEIRQSGEAVVIDHVAEDMHYAGHPTPAMYGFQSYISMPIARKNGEFFGTLCAIDPKPAQLNNQHVIGMFKLFADLIAFYLQAAEDVAAAEKKLVEEQKTAELREQFIAILGHDLRNPIGAISNTAQVLQMITEEKDILQLATVIKNSAYRMHGLIENILDFARGRMGEGIILNKNTITDLEQVLMPVVNELRTLWPDHTIETYFNLSEPVDCDSSRITQVLSNLLTNAITHGNKDEPIKITALTQEGYFKLSVANAGTPIPQSAMNRLFTAFYRAELKSGQNGLGLGLYIASEIARAHQGNINVVSTSEETCFTMSIPL